MLYWYSHSGIPTGTRISVGHNQRETPLLKPDKKSKSLVSIIMWCDTFVKCFTYFFSLSPSSAMKKIRFIWFY